MIPLEIKGKPACMGLPDDYSKEKCRRYVLMGLPHTHPMRLLKYLLMNRILDIHHHPNYYRRQQHGGVHGFTKATR